MIKKIYLDDENSLIKLPCVVNNLRKVDLILDTGASHTMLHSAILSKLGYTERDIVGYSKVSTANGIKKLPVYQIDVIHLVNDLSTISSILKKDLLVTSDTFDRADYQDADGILGLDFFRNLRLDVDFRSKILTVI
jgi:gag-polyprotein putative aspartyl protease